MGLFFVKNIHHEISTHRLIRLALLRSLPSEKRIGFQDNTGDKIFRYQDIISAIYRDYDIILYPFFLNVAHTENTNSKIH